LNKFKENNKLELVVLKVYLVYFLLITLLIIQKSSLICIDLFFTIDNNDRNEFLKNNEEMNFDFYISNCKNSNKITIHKITSDSFLKIIIKDMTLYIY